MKHRLVKFVSKDWTHFEFDFDDEVRSCDG